MTPSPSQALGRDIRSWRLRFALSVSQPAGKVLIVDRMNQNAGSSSVFEAVQRGSCFAVDVEDTVLAIDMDDGERGGDLDELAQELARAGVLSVIVASGREGGRHLFARVEDELLLQRVNSLGREKRLDARRTIRPPLAPHRDGLRPRLLEPASLQVALERLAPSRPTPSLSPGIQALLETEEGKAKYRSRSEVDMAIAVDAVNASWTFEEYRSALLSQKSGAGGKARDKLRQSAWAADRYLGLTWQRAQEFVREHPLSERPERPILLDQLLAVARGSAWEGRDGGSAAKVLFAVLEIAEDANAIEFTASFRQIAERAGMSPVTVRRVLSRRLGAWVQRLTIGEGTRGSEWRLRLARSRQRDTLELTPPLNGSNGSRTRLHPGHDAFRYGGLNASGLQVLSQLDPELPLTRKQLVIATGRHPSAVSEALKRLKACELADKKEAGWIRLERDLDVVAEELGTLGSGQRQKERHARERAGYHEYLEDRLLRGLSLKVRVDRTTGEILEFPFNRPSVDPSSLQEGTAT